MPTVADRDGRETHTHSHASHTHITHASQASTTLHTYSMYAEIKAFTNQPWILHPYMLLSGYTRV